MKVGLICFHSFSHPGGVKMHVLGLYNEFKKRGIRAKIIVPRRKLSERYGKDIILLGTSFNLKLAGTQTDFDVNFNPFAINKILKREKFDILHFHNFSFPSGYQILDQSESLNILTFHANIEKNKLFKALPFILKMFNKKVQDKIDGIIGVNPLNLRVFKNYRGPKIVIPNGIDLKVFNPRAKKIKRFIDGKINILFLGRLEERKGAIYLLRAYKILEKKLGSIWVEKNLRLLIVGEGPLKQKLEEWAQKNKLKNVIFESNNKEGVVQQYYATCGIYCSPAIYGESFGIVLIEAMAVGRPVVAFSNSGYKIVLGKGKGEKFLAKPKDYKVLAEKLEILIRSKSKREEMGRWGIRESKQYSWPKVADRVLDFYELCRERKRFKSS